MVMMTLFHRFLLLFVAYVQLKIPKALVVIKIQL